MEIHNCRWPHCATIATIITIWGCVQCQKTEEYWYCRNHHRHLNTTILICDCGLTPRETMYDTLDILNYLTTYTVHS